jgi:MerR family transcriptional regulator, mercuric resistance operon regulatory protein
MREALTIGRLAKAAGVNVETVRYYQRRGLIDEPRKPPGGHRRYAATVVEQLGFIRRAQQLGFSLEEVRALLELANGGSCRDARSMAEQKLEVLGARMAQLARMQRELQGHIDSCMKRKRGEPCPFIKTLFGRE